MAIIIIVSIHLETYISTTDPTLSNPTGVEWDEVCMLGDADGNLCVYAYVVAGLSLALSLALSIFLCFTCNLCGLGPVLEAICSGFGAVWWLAASLVFSAYVGDANSADPEFYPAVARWRNAVAVLSWVTFGLFTAVFTVYIGKMLAKICACFNCCDDGDEGKKESA
ncbi:hypothetical protein FOA52_004988 [Chlamydomonas sp. UWO 241]|nr:hypothetical protein FOA52_004988 [Chlamydomonas sp. UWO 241]